ncbi:epoxide hydrolase 1-like [Bidens hawaiensis]|uniref:epoxide hydrolase 1-like n=1 Tax=Bidens hawaiensis TaxID=980011 RepID=UPI00404B3F39
MEHISHKTIEVNGINMHIAEMGQGPVVLLLHGFPELWYSWCHQILFLAANGYRAIAPDLRGFGDTTWAPVDDPTKFSSLHVVGDLVALIDALGEDKVFVVGHDWGATIAWRLCLFRPDKVKGLVNFGVHFSPRNPQGKDVEMFRAVYGDDHYICRLQEPGEIEAVFANVGTMQVIKKFLTHRDLSPYYFPKGKPFGDEHNTPVILPSWLTEEDVDCYAKKFEQTGFTGGINYYRCFDINWELEAPWTNAKINVPTQFVVGELDVVYNIPIVKEYIHNGGFHEHVPLLEEVVVIEDAAHFVTQEVPDKVNKHIFDFLQKF